MLVYRSASFLQAAFFSAARIYSGQINSAVSQIASVTFSSLSVYPLRCQFILPGGGQFLLTSFMKNKVLQHTFCISFPLLSPLGKTKLRRQSVLKFIVKISIVDVMTGSCIPLWLAWFLFDFWLISGTLSTGKWWMWHMPGNRLCEGISLRWQGLSFCAEGRDADGYVEQLTLILPPELKSLKGVPHEL